MMENSKKYGCVLILVFLADLVEKSEETYKNCTIGNKTTLVETEDCRCVEEQSCNEGLIVPLWRPVRGYSTGEMYLRAFVYFFALLYLFLGVSVVADRFMAAIETITSQEKEIVVKRKNGEKVSITIRVWNETVSNLTLMALGSSAPEILLSIIEVCHKDFRAGDLGPNTIVGSAAFNLFIIIAICIVAVPDDEIRRQRYLRVFLVTATWSIFAYIWLYLIISVFSAGVVEIWEAFLTFLFFPITVITAYVADQKLIDYRFLTKKYRRSKKNRDGTVLDLKPDELQPCMLEKAIQEADDDSKTPNLTSKELKLYEETRKQFGEILKKLKAENPNADSQFLQREAEYRMMMKARKSRAFYRIQNGQKICGGGNFIKKRLIKQREDSLKRKNSQKCVDLESATPACKIYFNPPYYTVMENEGFVEVTVTCEGQLPDDSCLKVDYFTIDGTAQAESDYVAVSGCLVFLSSDVQRHKRVKVPIIDDDIFEEDEHFYVCLSNPRIEYDQTSPKNHSNLFIQRPDLKLELVEPHMATIMILDDDHAGVFSFENKSYAVSESAGHIEIRVLRTSGARGKVLVSYKTVEGTATADKDFEPKDSYLEFDNEETEKTIVIGIVNDEEYEKTETFYIQLEEPVWIEKMSDPSKIVEKYKKRQQRKLSNRTTDSVDSSLKTEDLNFGNKMEVEMLGKPHLGQYQKCSVKIIESTEFKGFIDQLMKKANLSLIVGTSSWREQFSEALSVNSSEETGDEKQENPPPRLADYVGHYVTLPWKLVGACCPPTSYYNGKLCFVASIILIGVFTAIIGDLANYFGCTVGLKDAVTAISFVAMGTSVPDLFASKTAAVQDKYADSSIGNVTGSNAVNVFLGIGVAWTLCAVAAALRNDPNGFQVDPGSLAFSVTIFCTDCTFVMITSSLLYIFNANHIEQNIPSWFLSLIFLQYFLTILLADFMANQQIEVFGEKTPAAQKIADAAHPTTTKYTLQSKPSAEKIVAGGGNVDSALNQSPKSSPDVSGGGDAVDKAEKTPTTTAAGKSELHVKWLEVKKIVIDYTTPAAAADGVKAASLDPNAPLELPPVELLPSIPEPPSLKSSESSAAAEASKLPTKEVTKKSDNVKEQESTKVAAESKRTNG